MENIYDSARRSTLSFLARARHRVGAAYHQLMASESYLEGLTDEQIFEGAFAPNERAQFDELERTCQDSERELRERAAAFIATLGGRYRAQVEAQAVRRTVRMSQTGRHRL